MTQEHWAVVDHPIPKTMAVGITLASAVVPAVDGRGILVSVLAAVISAMSVAFVTAFSRYFFDKMTRSLLKIAWDENKRKRKLLQDIEDLKESISGDQNQSQPKPEVKP